MSDWQTDLRNALEEMTEEVESIALEVSREAIGILDRLVAFSDDFMVDMTTSFTQEIETPTPISEFLNRDLEEFLDSLLRPFVDLSMQDLSVPHNPVAAPHALCADCENYHGQIYGGTPLVCGMHPYGIVEGQEDCADRTVKPEEAAEPAEPKPSNFPPDWWNS
jgi:hypothetical protein